MIKTCRSDAHYNAQERSIISVKRGVGLPDVLVALNVDLVEHRVLARLSNVRLHLHGNVSRQDGQQESLLQAGRQAGRQTGRQTNRYRAAAGRTAGGAPTGGQVGGQVDRQTGRQVGRQLFPI